MNNDVKALKGPWTVSINNKLEIIGVSDLGTFIKIGTAYKTVFIDGCGEHKISYDTALANARLMAAAPEMFELIEGILNSSLVNILKDHELNQMQRIIEKIKGVV